MIPVPLPDHAPAVVADRAGERDLVRGALARDPEAIRSIMRRYNRRLFRVARSILRDDSEAEDALQESYLRAFSHLGEFRGDAALSTWLSRIVINESLGRLRKLRASTVSLDALPKSEADIIAFPAQARQDDPERTMAQREIMRLVERAIDDLPEIFRTVLVARMVEGMSIEETAELLSIRPETVKTRLFRARELLREQIDRQLDPVVFDAFPFPGRRCERVFERVVGRLCPA